MLFCIFSVPTLVKLDEKKAPSNLHSQFLQAVAGTSNGATVADKTLKAFKKALIDAVNDISGKALIDVGDIKINRVEMTRMGGKVNSAREGENIKTYSISGK